jgi:hypothetical protein
VSDEYGRETGEDRDDRDPCVCGHSIEEHSDNGYCALCSCLLCVPETDRTPLEAI